jgi:hypothetical protein
MKTIIRRVALITVLLSSGLVAQSNGTPIGDIQVVYNATNPFGIPANLDGPAFVIENFSATAITGGLLSILVGGDNGTLDTFNVGTIAAGSFVVIIPGESNDGGVGHTFFAFTGSVLDTSDTGPNSDSVPFSFSGLLGALTVNSGIFTPGPTRHLANDGTISINFLGNQDPPCNNCFGPTVVAELNTPSTAPDQGATFALLLMAFLSCGLFHWHSKGRQFV